MFSALSFLFFMRFFCNFQARVILRWLMEFERVQCFRVTLIVIHMPIFCCDARTRMIINDIVFDLVK